MPDHSGMDSLDDILREVAVEELRELDGKPPQKRVVAVVVRIAHKGIERAAEAGVLPGTSEAKFNEAQARLIAEAIDASNPKMFLQCIDFVFGHGIMLGVSQTAIAEMHGMTKSTVSNICVGIRERYGVRPSRGMKSLDACESYRVRQTGKRAKPTRENWLLAGELKQAFYAAA
jgi:hypothetical protein